MSSTDYDIDWNSWDNINTKVDKIIEIINNNYYEPNKLKEICNHYGIKKSRYYYQGSIYCPETIKKYDTNKITMLLNIFKYVVGRDPFDREEGKLNIVGHHEYEEPVSVKNNRN